MDYATFDYVIVPRKQAALPVRGGGLFPVHRIYCVRRNHAAHTVEMGGAARQRAASSTWCAFAAMMSASVRTAGRARQFGLGEPPEADLPEHRLRLRLRQHPPSAETDSRHSGS